MSLEARRFILENTSILSPPHVPEVCLHLASEAHELWHRTEEQLAESGLPPPFWAFAWAGGQGLVV
jgi:predicted nicotinamide N-methyase